MACFASLQRHSRIFTLSSKIKSSNNHYLPSIVRTRWRLAARAFVLRHLLFSLFSHATIIFPPHFSAVKCTPTASSNTTPLSRLITSSPAIPPYDKHSFYGSFCDTPLSCYCNHTSFSFRTSPIPALLSYQRSTQLSQKCAPKRFTFFSCNSVTVMSAPCNFRNVFSHFLYGSYNFCAVFTFCVHQVPERIQNWYHSQRMCRATSSTISYHSGSIPPDPDSSKLLPNFLSLLDVLWPFLNFTGAFRLSFNTPAPFLPSAHILKQQL